MFKFNKVDTTRLKFVECEFCDGLGYVEEEDLTNYEQYKNLTGICNYVNRYSYYTRQDPDAYNYIIIRNDSNQMVAVMLVCPWCDGFGTEQKSNDIQEECPYCKNTVYKIKCNQCDSIDRSCSKCGYGSGHTHALTGTYIQGFQFGKHS